MVQAEGASPFYEYMTEKGANGPFRAQSHPETLATAIKIGDPASYERGVRAIRETDGVVIDVSDAEILEAKAVIDASGVGCEPASAASVAGVRKLAREGTISAGDRVVAVLTGHILKDPGILLDYHKDAKRPLANTPIEIDAEVGAVERVLTEAASTWRQR